MTLIIPWERGLCLYIRLESEQGFAIFVYMKQSKDWLKKIRIRWIIQVVLLVAVWVVMRFPVLGEWYARKRSEERRVGKEC